MQFARILYWTIVYEPHIIGLTTNTIDIKLTRMHDHKPFPKAENRY